MKEKYLLPTKIYLEIISKVESGKKRRNVGTARDAEGKKVYNRKVYIDEKGYDKGGAFWGIGETIYVKFTIDKTFIHFTYEKEKVKPKIVDRPLSVYQEIICRVEASQGRQNVGTKEDAEGKKIYQRKVIIDTEGYDKGGAYWGVGDPLFVDFTLDKTYTFFHREHYGN